MLRRYGSVGDQICECLEVELGVSPASTLAESFSVVNDDGRRLGEINLDGAGVVPPVGFDEFAGSALQQRSQD